MAQLARHPAHGQLAPVYILHHSHSLLRSSRLRINISVLGFFSFFSFNIFKVNICFIEILDLGVEKILGLNPNYFVLKQVACYLAKKTSEYNAIKITHTDIYFSIINVLHM